MDPDATLALFWEAYDAGDHDACIDAARDLHDWLRLDGYQPSWKAYGGRERYLRARAEIWEPHDDQEEYDDALHH